MGGKSTSGSDVAQSIGAGMHEFGKGETAALHKINQANYAGAMPRAEYLADQTRNNATDLSLYGRNVVGPNSDISRAAQGVQRYGDLSAGAGMDIYNTGLGMGNQLYNQGMGIGNDIYNQGLGLGSGVYNQGLAYGADAMNQANAFIGGIGSMGDPSRPSIQLGTAQQGSVANGQFVGGSTDAGRQGKAYFNEWQNTFAPAVRQQIADAQAYNTASHREYLAQQAAADAGLQFQNMQAQNARARASYGINPASGASMALDNQAALANAAYRAGTMTNTRRVAEKEGWDRVNTALTNQAGSHLMNAANQAMGIEADVTNTNTSNRTAVTNTNTQAQASVANANTAAAASVTNTNTGAQADLARAYLDAQTSSRNAQLSAAASVFNAGLDARSRDYATGTQGLMNGYQTGSQGLLQGYQTGSQAQLQGYQTGSQGLMQGLNQGINAYDSSGKLYGDAGRLAIDAGRAANEAASTSLGLYMTPQEQYFQNYLSAMQPEMWGLTGAYNGFMGGRQIEAGNNANQAGLTNSIIGAVGTVAGGLLSDRRLKQDIVRVGTYYNGLPQYEFAYRDNPGVRYRGVMADEVEAVMPEAVFTGPDGYQRVRYDLLGIEMEEV